MLVICDINIYKQGHYIGFNQFLLNEAKKIRELFSGQELLFLFNEEAATLLNIPGSVAVEFLSFPKEWRDSPLGRWKIWTMVKEKMKAFRNAHLYFMDFDKFQLPIGIRTTPFELSGIYFRPHHRIEKSNNSTDTRFQTWIKKRKKILAETILLQNTSIKNIFILNDSEGADYLNRFHKKNSFRYLPDPVFDYGFEPDRINRNNGEISFLIFGALTERKNIRQLINSFGRARFTQKAVLYLVGKTDTEEYLQSLKTLAETVLRAQEHEKKILFNTDFVSDEEMEKYHAATHISLLVYRNFFGSSGLIGRAAKHRQLVIAPSVGLLAEITRQYQLGITVDPLDQDAIARAMENAAATHSSHPFEGAARFYEEHHPNRFLEILFSID